MKCSNQHQQIEFIEFHEGDGCPLCCAIEERTNAEDDFDRVTDTDKKLRKRDTAFLAALVFNTTLTRYFPANEKTASPVEYSVALAVAIFAEAERRNP